MTKTMSSSIFHVLFPLLFVMLLVPAQAIKQSYIVYLGSHSFGLNPTSVDLESATNSHYDLLGSYVGSREKAKEAIFYSYNRYINGFAAVLDEEEAANIAKHPNVLSVFLNRNYKLHTTHSWDFLGLEKGNGKIPNASIWQKSLGEDIIIGNLDTGVWPESKSFSDEGLGPIPAKWYGKCVVDSKNKDKFHCNRKLIGARYFYKGLLASGGPKNASYASPRDFEGHGSHTLSTAGGNFVRGASVFGIGKGTASGGSPKARVAAYKVCWKDGCNDADILAGFEAAIGDGVDVISMSLGSDFPVPFYLSGTSIGSFHAISHGVVVVASGGNSGPDLGTVCNMEPWMLTVAASTIDREFSSYVTLGNKKIVKGVSLSQSALPSGKMYPLINAVDAKLRNANAADALLCKDGTLDQHKVKGKIVVCIRGVNGRTEKGVIVAKAGAVGMILANDEAYGNEILSDPHVLPASHVGFNDSSYILKYINSTKSPLAYISRVKTVLGVKSSPTIAAFSSRGPSIIEPKILKPDITAPGVDIIAAYSGATSPTEEESDKRRVPFITMSGTSMSCPHVAGIVGLLKSLHPYWSPAAIKSAILTTATTKDNTGKPILDSSSSKAATPFAYGSGHIQPDLAMDPGLVYDLSTSDYLNFLCGVGYNSSQLQTFYQGSYTCPKSFNIANFNYPSITIDNLVVGHRVSATRTLTNVGSPSKYKVHVEAPPHVLVSVHPRRLIFKNLGDKLEFRITLTLKSPIKDYVFGKLVWTDGKHHVNTPITVNMQS